MHSLRPPVSLPAQGQYLPLLAASDSGSFVNISASSSSTSSSIHAEASYLYESGLFDSPKSFDVYVATRGQESPPKVVTVRQFLELPEFPTQKMLQGWNHGVTPKSTEQDESSPLQKMNLSWLNSTMYVFLFYYAIYAKHSVVFSEPCSSYWSFH